MKICIATKYKSWDCGSTGKGFFIQRLTKALRKLGCEIVKPGQPADIDLQIGKRVWSPNADVEVLRLGAAHIDKRSDYKALNKRKSKAMKKCDAVIYQSKFSKELCESFLGKVKKSRVIFNGASLQYYENLVPRDSPRRVNFCAVTRKWTPQKRLREVIKSFELADIPSSMLWIVGDCDKYHAKGVSYLRKLDQKELGELYRLCNAFIHLTSYDACPNAAVEALAAGCPVITNNQNGAAEFATVVLPIYPKWNFMPVNFKNLPDVDCMMVAEAMREYTKKELVVNNAVIDINVIARKYKEYFEELLNGH